jgi:hypothetical protein
MHPQITSLLANEHQRDLASQASRHRMAASLRGPRRHTLGWRTLGWRTLGWRTLGWRVPRYRVNWSRTTLSPADLPGRERSWVIVISASRGASFPHSG